MLEFPILQLTGMRIVMFQLSTLKTSKQTSGPGLRARASRGSCATQNFHRLRLPSSYVVAIRRI